MQPAAATTPTIVGTSNNHIAARNVETLPAAVCDGDLHCSYQELVAKAIVLAEVLAELSQNKECPVAILLPRGINLYVSQLAVLFTGGFFLPIDPNNPADRIQFLLEDSQAKIVLADHATRDLFESPSHNLSVVDVNCCHNADSNSAANISLESLLNHQPDDLAYMIYTSGSTGKPKGVPVHWAAIDNHNQWFIDTFGIGGDDRCMQIASPGFDISIEEILPTFRAGAALYPAPKSILQNPRSFFEWIAEHELTVLNIPTALWHTLVPMLSEFQLPDSVRLVLIGGEQANPQIVEQWHSYVDPNKVRLVNAYGPTEVTITCAVCDLKPGHPVSIGRPISNIDCYLIDESNQLVIDYDTPGELYFRGAGVTRGYWNRPEKTGQVFSQFGGRWDYRTGDMAKFDSDGNLYFLGRCDSQIKFRGFRIELTEISKTVCLHASVHHAVVQKLGDVNEQLVCFVVTAGPLNGSEDQEQQLESQLLKFLGAKLPAHMLPTKFVFLEEFPLTVGDKIDTKKLEAMLQPKRSAAVTWESMTARLVAEAWKATLGCFPETPESKFEKSGGDSLSAMTFVIELERRFPSRRIGVAAISANPSVVELAKFIDSDQAQKRTDPNAPIITFINEDVNQQRDYLLFFHAAGGGNYIYRSLISDQMLQKYSVVMVESPFLTGEIPADAGPPSVHAFAEHYTEALAAQLDSNFKVVTAGFSMGGFLAFEVASGLQNKGFEINRVINIDQPLATAMQKASLPQRALNWLYRFRSPGVALDDLVTVAKKKLIRSVGVTALNDAMASDMLKSIELEEFYVRGDNDYRPRPADLSLHLIRGGVFEAKYILSEDYGWSKFVTRLQSHRMFGTHSTLFAAANFSKLLELFNQALESKE